MAMKQATYPNVHHPYAVGPLQNWDWRDYFVSVSESFMMLGVYTKSFAQDYHCNNWYSCLWRSLTLQGPFITIG